MKGNKVLMTPMSNPACPERAEGACPELAEGPHNDGGRSQFTIIPTLVMVLITIINFACDNTSRNDLLNGNFGAIDTTPVNLLAPTDQSVVSKTPTFSFSKRAGAVEYTLTLAITSDFAAPILSKTLKYNEETYALTNSDLIDITALDDLTYYWKIIAHYANGSEVASSTSIFHILGDNIVYVNVNSEATQQIGNKSSPFKSIQGGIENANVRRDEDTDTAMEVYVSKGTYNEEISLRPGISIRGGYASTTSTTGIDWNRDISTNTTTISTPSDKAVKGSSTITSSYTTTTVVEGFTIVGSNIAGIINYAVYLSGSPTIKQNTISVGDGTESRGIFISNGSSPLIDSNVISSGSSTLYTYTIYNENSSATISNNTLNNGYGAQNTYAIYNKSSLAPTISNNTIDGGSAGTGFASYGIYSASSSTAIITKNVIGGGTGEKFAYAIYNNSSSPEITNNNLSGGTGITGSYGAFLSSSNSKISGNTFYGGYGASSFGIVCSGGSPEIANNIIVGGSGTTFTWGISSSSSSTATILNNTIDGGVGSTSYGILLSSAITIKNNIIFNTGTGSRTSVRESVASADPTSFANNNLFDAGSGGTYVHYRDHDSGCTSNNDGDADSQTCNLADISDITTPTPSGIISINNSGSQLFVNAPGQYDTTKDGPDGDSSYNGTATTIETTDCQNNRYVVNEYIEYNDDGVARQISNVDCTASSSTITFSPSLSSSSTVGIKIALWGTNSSNITDDFNLQMANATICNVAFGGLDLSATFSTDKANTTRTATLPGGSPCSTSNTGAAGWSMGAFEKD